MSRKNNAFAQAIVGLFMVTVLLLLGYFTIVVSGVDMAFGRKRQPLQIAFEQVGGLKDRDSVMYRGTKVGIVDRVEVTASNLIVHVSVDTGLVLRDGYRIAVGNLSMLGGNYLILEEGAGEPLDLATAKLRGETPTDWMQDVSRIARNLNELTSRSEVRVAITNFAAISVKVREFVDRANRVAANADRVVARVERGEGMVGKLLSSDSTAYDDLQRTVANAREISERLNRAKLYEDLEAGVTAFREAAQSFDVKATVAKADRLLENLNAVAEGLRRGDGTLGKLVNDPQLYEEVNGVIRDVRQVIDNYRDTTPISTFSSLALGAF